MASILKHFSSLRMIQQMNLLMVPILAVVISSLIVIQLLNINVTNSYFSQSTTQMYNVQNYKQICVRLERVVRISRQLLNMNAYKMQSINLLYNKSFENTGSNYSVYNLPLNSTNPSYYGYPLMTYYPYGNKILDEQTQQFTNFTSILNTLMFTFDQTSMITSNAITMAFNSSSAILATTPAIPTIQDYNPLERSWYLKQVENYQMYGGNNSFITNIFFSLSPLVYMQSVQHCLLKNGFRGLVGTNFDFGQMKKLLAVSNDNIILIYNNGVILFQNAFIDYFLLNQTASVFDENITGFNQTQWELFKNTASQSQFSNIVATYNSVFKKQMTINIHKFPNLRYYLMLFANLEEDQNSKTLSQNIISSLLQRQIDDLITIGVCDATLLILLSISIFIIIHPIKRIKWHIRHSQKINQTNTMFLAKRGNNQLLDLELNLIKLILRMKKSSMIKSNLCSILEKFKWPKQLELIKNFELDEVFDTNQMISNKIIISRIKQAARREPRRGSDFDEQPLLREEDIRQLIYSFFTKS